MQGIWDALLETLVELVLTGGEAFDLKAVDRLVRMPVQTPRFMLADKGRVNQGPAQRSWEGW